ncbi:NfeD family protein [Sphingorhabdus sp. Alg231-15]|uniref:NfeD family protein n=1 Tax=Sphingorhabdus sp. Alg231-15 TaxID=1922222 RepID=UPI00307BF55E
MIRLEGAIGPASASYVADGFERAQSSNAELVIILMDTPGGLDTSMRRIIQDILAMPIPVVTYVHPSGARAASAGTYILYASHFTAMTPGTNLGAATPIQIGAVPAPEADKEGDEGGNPPTNAAAQKAVNDSVAYIRSLAELRGRNAEWAEAAVRQAESLSANAALDQDVVDIVAPNITSLLEQLDGKATTINGEEYRVATADITITEFEADWATQLLATLTNPNIALVFLMIGMYGLIFEFLNPGALVPGTVGAISLLIAFYALAVLPVDMVGLALILLGVGLLVGEAFAPSFGILGIGGIVAFSIGATMLFDTDISEFRVDWSVIAALAIFSAGLLVFVLRIGIRSIGREVVSGVEELVGASAIVIDWDNGKGHVFIHSERWNAQGPANLSEGQEVVVNGVQSLKLKVSRAQGQSDPSKGG